MYRQILVDTKQITLQRILWRSNPADKIKTYELRTLTYGTAPAAFIATKVIQQLANSEAHRFPKGAAAARTDFYVDDFVSGASTQEEALEIGIQLAALLKEGGFKLHKWSSNSLSILNKL